MKYLILLIALSFSTFSYGFSCPEDTNLNDKSARDKCFYNIMIHWQRVAEKIIIKTWQDGVAGRAFGRGNTQLKGGMNESTHWVLFNKYRLLFRDLLVLQRMIDRFEKEGVYQKPYKETPPAQD